MPTIPSNNICNELGCKNTKSKFSAFCLQHGGRDTYNYKKYNSNAERKKANAQYNHPAWPKMRMVQLSKHPLCAACLGEGKITQAQHVDHVFPWRLIGPSGFFHNYLQSLCASCHSHKTSLEAKGIFRHYLQPHVDYTMSDYVPMLQNMGN